MNKQEFIAELSDKVNEVGEISQWHSGYKKGLYDALVLTRKLEESDQEKVVVPQFVAEYLEDKSIYSFEERIAYLIKSSDGDSFYLHELLPESSCITEDEGERLYEYAQGKELGDLLQLINGYTVEKEKRYRLRIAAPILNEEMFLNRTIASSRFFLDNANNTEFHQTIFTEKELEDIDETGFVRELEEETE